MFRKTLLACVAWACLAGTVSAQENQVDLDVSAAFLTKYIWNGFDRIESLGLDQGPVLQPRVSAGLGSSPLRAFVAGSFVVNDASELHETSYGALIERFSSPFTKIGLGYTYYDDRVVPLTGLEDNDSHEIWADVSVRNTAGMETSFGGRYEMSARSAYEPYWVFHGLFGYTSTLVPGNGLTSMGLDMRSFTRILYNTQIEQEGVELVRRGFSAWQLGVALDLKAASVQVSPSIHYQFTLEESVNDEDPLWGGINVAYAF
jgi:hypothetical protein